MIPQLFLHSLPEKNAILSILTAFLLVALVLCHHLLLGLLQETNKGEHTNHKPFFVTPSWSDILTEVGQGLKRGGEAILLFLHFCTLQTRPREFGPADDVFSPILFRVHVITLFARRRSTSLTEVREEEVKKGKL